MRKKIIKYKCSSLVICFLKKEETVLNLKIYLIIIIFFLISFIPFNSNYLIAQQEGSKYTIVIHGGAGYFSKDTPEEIKQQYINSLTEALNIGKNILSGGGTSLDAV